MKAFTGNFKNTFWTSGINSAEGVFSLLPGITLHYGGAATAQSGHRQGVTFKLGDGDIIRPHSYQIIFLMKY